jgi:hypothetical protein
MSTSKVLVSLTTRANDYQRAQAASVESAARRLGVHIEIIYADNDPVLQSRQIITAIEKKNTDWRFIRTRRRREQRFPNALSWRPRHIQPWED